jgi:hypothetical protein
VYLLFRCLPDALHNAAEVYVDVTRDCLIRFQFRTDNASEFIDC